MDEFNNEVVKVLKDDSFKMSASYGVTGAGNVREYTFLKKYWIPDKHVYKFGPTDAGINHNQEDIYVLVSCYDASGTLLTDNIGAFRYIANFKYRDP